MLLEHCYYCISIDFSENWGKPGKGFFFEEGISNTAKKEEGQKSERDREKGTCAQLFCEIPSGDVFFGIQSVQRGK